MRGAKQTVIVSVELLVVRFGRLPGRAAGGDGIGMVSGPPRVRKCNIAGNAAAVVADQDIEFGGDE